MRIRWGHLLVHLISWIVGLIWVIPIMGILMASIRPHREIIHGWWQISEIHLTLENFVNAWNHPSAPMGEGLRNSFAVAIPATILPLLLGTMAAYGLLRLRFWGRGTIFLAIVLLMSVPQQMVAVPLFRIMLNLNLLDALPGLVIAHTAWGLPWIILFMRNFLLALPIELEEAASLDGATRLQVFYKIILPMAVPALASVAALQFTWIWNDFFMALVLLYNPHLLVATQRIPMLKGEYHIDWGILTAASVLTMAIPILVFVVLQKQYVRGFIGWTTK